MAHVLDRSTGGYEIAAKSTDRFTFFPINYPSYPPDIDPNLTTQWEVERFLDSYIAGLRDFYDKAYFNVSIAPEVDGNNPVITGGLVEIKRERSSFARRGPPFFWNNIRIYESKFLGIQPLLYLTLQNDNDFKVKFLAAHVFIR
jgi:hypothetical protein